MSDEAVGRSLELQPLSEEQKKFLDVIAVATPESVGKTVRELIGEGIIEAPGIAENTPKAIVGLFGKLVGKAVNRDQVLEQLGRGPTDPNSRKFHIQMRDLYQAGREQGLTGRKRDLVFDNTDNQFPVKLLVTKLEPVEGGVSIVNRVRGWLRRGRANAEEGGKVGEEGGNRRYGLEVESVTDYVVLEYPGPSEGEGDKTFLVLGIKQSEFRPGERGGDWTRKGDFVGSQFPSKIELDPTFVVGSEADLSVRFAALHDLVPGED